MSVSHHNVQSLRMAVCFWSLRDVDSTSSHNILAWQASQKRKLVATLA